MDKKGTMSVGRASKLLRHVKLVLARDHDFPDGSVLHNYEFVAPIDRDGHLVDDAWRLLKDRCRVRRRWGQEPPETGHLVRKPGGRWAFHYDIHGDPDHDERGFHFETHKFLPGEYVSITELDGMMRTFRVQAVGDVE